MNTDFLKHVRDGDCHQSYYEGWWLKTYYTPNGSAIANDSNAKPILPVLPMHIRVFNPKVKTGLALICGKQKCGYNRDV